MTVTAQPPRTAAGIPAQRAAASASQPRPTTKERRAAGKALRSAVPLDSHAEFARAATAREPLSLLEEQAADRLAELGPIRYGRMLASPFAYYRGAARVMAADLAGTPRSGLIVQMCGDAHVSNFGLYGSPERRLVFDANDFDETLPGPFEFDVKRLVASISVAGRVNGMTRKQRRSAALAAGARYRTAMAEFAAARDIEVWYSHLDADQLLRDVGPKLDDVRRKKLARAFDKARSRDTMQAFGKLTEVVDGQLRIVAQPPLVVPLRDLVGEGQEAELTQSYRALLRQYRTSLQSDRRALLERYSFVDMARKVVGVGSVGTRCWIALMTGRDEGDPLLLQIKEAAPSVHAEFVGKSKYPNQGQRVVAGQRLMQQASDIFLGWQRFNGIDGRDRDFYVRQLRDWKGSITIENLQPEGLQIYGELCAWCLARAHARSGDRIAIAGYLGSSPAFENAVAEFAEAYADVTDRDHHDLADAVASGRVEARTGL
jgi:uncharacterized protein (DUF2252 family)